MKINFYLQNNAVYKCSYPKIILHSWKMQFFNSNSKYQLQNLKSSKPSTIKREKLVKLYREVSTPFTQKGMNKALFLLCL